LEDGSPIPDWLKFTEIGTLAGKPTNPGIYKIKVKVTDTEDNIATAIFQLTVKDPSTGLNGDPKRAGFKIYPNPTKGEFKIDLGKAHENQVIIDIIDIQGKQIIKQYYQKTKSAIINLNNYPKGLYIAKIIYSGGIDEMKILKE
jgi:hypothetical protein